jgi:pimeloyl-ACP methyl ester carboxylesterase
MNEPEIGYFPLHSDAGLNFTLNRLVRTIDKEELQSVASRINSLEDWIREMKSAGEKAERDGRLIEAARYYQGAEFYMANGDSDKVEIYKHSLKLFNDALPELAKSRHTIPYESDFLPVVRVASIGDERGTIVIHSGFDGLIEEMYPLLQPFSEAGYTVIAFEGPGQGAALREHGLSMPFNWEKPVSAVLDHYEIEDCTLIGMSLGGYLAPRAAAFEKRVSRVIAWGAMFDFYAVYQLRLGNFKHRLLTLLLDLKLSGVVNKLIEKASAKEATMRWAITHGMHVSGTQTPFEFLQWVRSLNLRDSAAHITQDVLLIMGNDDHLVPSNQLYVQAQSMVNARSVTTSMLSNQDHAAEHCQVGNSMLPVRLILEWMSSIDRR